MAIHWVDPYRHINSSYACHGTTGAIASRDGSYANPWGLPDLYGATTSSHGYLGAALSSGDEIRIKGEPINHIWLTAQAVTYGASATKLNTTSTIDSGFGTSGTVSWSCALFEPYSTSNSAKNYDHYNTSRPYVHPNLRVTVNTSDAELSSKTNQHDPYWEALTRSTYSSVGSTLTFEMRLLDPAFANVPSDIPTATSTSTFMSIAGISSYTGNLLITDRWSSETAQSSSYYSFIFLRPHSTGTVYYNFNPAMDAPNTYFIWVDPSDSYVESNITTSQAYDYGAGNYYYYNNTSANHKVGGYCGVYYYYYQGSGTTSSSAQRARSEEYGIIGARYIADIRPYGGTFQGALGNNFDVYFHLTSTTQVYLRGQYLNAWPTSYTGLGKFYFGERYNDGYYYVYNGEKFTDGWSINFPNNGAVYNTLSRPLWSITVPTNVNFGTTVYNGATLPFDQSDGTKSLSDYPTNGGQVTVEKGDAPLYLIDLSPTVWYQSIQYLAPTINANQSFHWIGEIQVPANTTLENVVPNEGGLRSYSYKNLDGLREMKIYSTNIPDDDRVVWFPALYYNTVGFAIAYLNSDGDVELRVCPDSSGNYPYGFSVPFSIPCPKYYDSNGSAIAISGVPVMVKSFHGTGAYYQDGNITLGGFTAGSGWNSGFGGNYSISSTTFNSTNWVKKSLSYSSSNVATKLPGPFTSPPTAPIDHVTISLAFERPTGNNFASGMKYLFRVVPPDEWGDY